MIDTTVIQGNLAVPAGLKSRCTDILNDSSLYRMADGNWHNVSSTYRDLPGPRPHTWVQCQSLIDVTKSLTDGEISKSWMNIIHPGGYAGRHFHVGANHSVLTYCVQQTQSPLEFLIEDQWVPYHCATGDWFFFSKFLTHRVGTNLTDHLGIFITINF
jgi:hypothetical protein